MTTDAAVGEDVAAEAAIAARGAARGALGSAARSGALGGAASGAASAASTTTLNDEVEDLRRKVEELRRKNAALLEDALERGREKLRVVFNHPSNIYGVGGSVDTAVPEEEPGDNDGKAKFRRKYIPKEIIGLDIEEGE